MSDVVLEFDTDDPEFGRGFEAGRIWEMLKSDPVDLDEQPIHAGNAKMVMRMLDVLDLSGIITCEFSDDENWLYLVAV